MQVFTEDELREEREFEAKQDEYWEARSGDEE